MNSSPCAKLTTSMMPKISVSPEAISARIMPVTMPFTVWMMIVYQGMAARICSIPMVHTPRYWWMTASFTLRSDAAQ